MTWIQKDEKEVARLEHALRNRQRYSFILTVFNNTLDMPFKGRRPQEGMKEELNLKGTFWAFSSGNFDECCIQENTELGT